MNTDMNRVRCYLSDSLKDVTDWMTPMTDCKNPDLRQVMATSEILKNLSDAIHHIHSAGYHDDNVMPITGEDDKWGNANYEAKYKFKELEKHYIGFWRATADYASHPCENHKADMLKHFEHMLTAHDALAHFAHGNCGSICPEIATIMANRKAKTPS